MPRGSARSGLASICGSRKLRQATICERGSATIPTNEEFKRRYFSELDGRRQLVDQLAEKISEGTVTFLFAAKEERFNNAVALKEYLEKKPEGRFETAPYQN